MSPHGKSAKKKPAAKCQVLSSSQSSSGGEEEAVSGNDLVDTSGHGQYAIGDGHVQRGRNYPLAIGRRRDTQLCSWWTMSINESPQLMVQLLSSMQGVIHGSGRFGGSRCLVTWSTLHVHDDGRLAVQCKQAANFQTMYNMFRRYVKSHLPEGATENMVMQGYDALPSGFASARQGLGLGVLDATGAAGAGSSSTDPLPAALRGAFGIVRPSAPAEHSPVDSEGSTLDAVEDVHVDSDDSEASDPYIDVDGVFPHLKATRLVSSLFSLSTHPGPSFDCYQHGLNIGRGVHGAVTKCWYAGTELAVKHFDWQGRFSALREAMVCEAIGRHPNIVELFDAVQVPRPHVQESLLVFGYAGISLAEQLRSAHMTSMEIMQVARQLFVGMSHLHARCIYHRDIQPCNILVKRTRLGFDLRICDLAHAVEVARPRRPASVRTGPWFPTTELDTCFSRVTKVRYSSPEILMSPREGALVATGPTWLSSDVYAGGLVLCECARYYPHMVSLSDSSDDPASCEQQLEGLRAHYGPDEPFVAQATGRLATSNGNVPRTIRAGDNAMQYPHRVYDEQGSQFIDFMDDIVDWYHNQRATAHSLVSHEYPCGDRDMISYSKKVIPGHRHDWQAVWGSVSQEVLQWLRVDIIDPAAMCSQSQQTEHDGIKHVLSGKVSATASSRHLNGLSIEHFLPLPRLTAWLHAWKLANGESMLRLVDEARKDLRLHVKHQYQKGSQRDQALGDNGKHFMETPINHWFLTAGQVHIFRNPGKLTEAAHYDGGASVLHMGLTLYGRRNLELFRDEDPNDLIFDMPMAPGNVYFGVMTGCKHRVQHKMPRAPSETKDDHAVTVMIRTTLWPGPRSRLMKSMPSPKDMFKVVAQSMARSIGRLPWVNPDLETCKRCLMQAL